MPPRGLSFFLRPMVISISVQHWMQPFNFLAIWPGALFMAWVVQRQRNTWIGIIQHGLMNFSLFVVLVRGVIGS